MAVGQSGRIVLEIDPALKRALHSRLVGEGRHLKAWFLEQVNLYLNPQALPLAAGGGSPVPSGPDRKILRVAEPTTGYSLPTRKGSTTKQKRRRRSRT